MTDSILKVNKAYDILKSYNGANPLIKQLKRKTKTPLTNFEVEYILNSYEKDPIFYNKTVKIAKWYGEKLKNEYNIEFVPEKLYIGYVFGETENTYHMSILYRRSQPEILQLFVPKTAILAPLFVEDFKSLDVDFKKYDEMGKITIKEHQKNAIKFLLSRKKGIVSLDMGMGKEIDANTMLPTPNGFRRADTLQVGDYMFSSYGLPTKIIGRYPQGIKDIYEITFNDGLKVNCGLEHLWIAKRDTRKNWEVISLKDILKSGIHPKNNPNKNCWRIPMCRPAEYEERKYLFPPFAMGKLIDSNENVADEASWEKRRIPEVYLCGSVQQRLELLAGILDGKATFNKKAFIKYETKSKNIAHDIRMLVNSLGGIAMLENKEDCVEINLMTMFNPFADEQKNKEYDEIAQKAKPFDRYITDVRLVRESNAICFSVDSEDQSFLTENYVVTHNTVCSIVASIEGKYNKILVICPASLKTNWKREIERFVPSDDITIVEGSKWKENKYTIINYDILKNFYVVPKVNKKFKTKVYTEDGKVEWKTVEKIVKTEKSEIVEESLDNSQLFQSKFDLIIIDEAHRLSNNSSGMYEIVSDLLKRSKPDGVFELTGTMVKNNPINLYNILKLIDADVTKDWINYVKTYCDGKQIIPNKNERDYFTKQFLKSVQKDSWYDLTIKEKDDLDKYLDKNCKKIWLTNGASNLDELAERIKHLYYRETSENTLKSIRTERKVIEYELSQQERVDYENAWNDFILHNEEKDITKLIQNHKLIESSIFRQLLADLMVKNTIKITEQELNEGRKVVIFCCFDKELYTLQEHFKDKCVVYNGKMTPKKKDEAYNKFKTDPNCTVLIGNLQSASVGLNLNEASVVIFNNISFIAAENKQAEYRILRIGQDKDCKIYYQKFKDTYMDRMFEILAVKNEIAENTILAEDKK